MIPLIRLLAFVMIIYSSFFYLMPLSNQIKEFLNGFNVLKEISFWENIFLFVIFVCCGLGLYRLKRIARLIWLTLSLYLLIVNIPAIQMLIHGRFIKFNDAPLIYWVKSYGLIFLLIYSVVFLNLPRTKWVFQGKQK